MGLAGGRPARVPAVRDPGGRLTFFKNGSWGDFYFLDFY
jgi:hypothetical protein